ncbi:MAG TPA: radical SAM protein, partial [Myxococcota bacterium]|nr:radical SAM protein [Myxococcota bacterium]
ARVRVDDGAGLEVRRGGAAAETGEGGATGGAPFMLHDAAGGEALCAVEFVRAHGWTAVRTSDGLTPFEAGVEQLGDMLVVNVAPGCEYFRVSGDDGASLRCSFCAYGRFDKRSLALGQEGGRNALPAATPARLAEVLRAAVAGGGEAHHVYLTGGSLLSPAEEAERFLPLVEAVRAAVGDRLRVTVGSGAVDPQDSRRYRDAGADSACYNLETWDAATFRAACPGKHRYVGRERWIDGLLGAVEVFGRGNVGSAFVAGLELRPPAPGMTAPQMIESILEGAGFLLDRGVVPLYSPLWPVDGTAYGPRDGITPEQYLTLERAVYGLRAARRFPVPGWLICPGCSYMLLEVDFDRAFGLSASQEGA